MTVPGPDVALFVTCLVDLMRPTVGMAAVKLLKDAGCRVSVPRQQACCGQPAYNSGDAEDARAIALQVIAAFRGFAYVVAPSGSCAGMIRHHYPLLFAGDAALRAEAEDLARRTFELTQFLADVVRADARPRPFARRATYHDGCSGLREMGVKAQPRALLAKVAGLDLAEGEAAEVCCGFGGTFCVKYPAISARMTDAKLDDVVATGAEVLLGGDLGCLMTIAGRSRRRGCRLRVRHVAEVLAGMADGPAIGEGGE